MRACGQYSGSEIVSRIQAALEREPLLSRRALSRQVCEWLDWRAPNGKLQDVSCRKALLGLDRRGVIQLPKVNGEFAFRHPCAPPLPEGTKIAEVECSLAELGEIEIIGVSSRYSKASKVWNGLMATYHALGHGPLCGA